MVIAVDFDGTIVEHQFPEIGEPIKDSFRVLKQLQARGHKLVMWTCRYGFELQEAIDFCKENGLEFDAVNENIKEINFMTSSKIYADLYIDDRAFAYGIPINWNMIEVFMRIKDGLK